MDRLVFCIPRIIFQRESWLLDPVRFDKSCCLPTLPTSHEIGSNARVRCPGDMSIPFKLRDMSIPFKLHVFHSLNPRPRAPLHTGVTGAGSPAQEATVLGMLRCPLRQTGQAASERHVQGRTLQGRGMYKGQTLQVRRMYRGQTL